MFISLLFVQTAQIQVSIVRNRNTLGDFSRANSGQDSAWKSAREEKEKEDEKWSGHCLVIVLIYCFVRAMGMEMRKQ